MFRKFRVITAAVLVVAHAACSPEEPNQTDATAAGSTASDVWSTRLDDGTVVRVRPQATPVREGRNTFLIEIEPVPVDESAVTIDLLSPSMPAHGIARYHGVPAGPGRFRADAQIPMAGDWSLYVNLDAGKTAAPFSFDVVAADDTAPAAQASGDHTHASRAGRPARTDSGG